MYKLQNIIFPSSNNCTYKELYFRTSKEWSYILDSDCINFEKDDFAFFDTYFNSFSAVKWYKYTNIENVSLCLKLRGKFRLELLHKERFAHELVEKKIKEIVIDTNKRDREILLDYNCDDRTGMYSFNIISLTDGAKFYGGYYYTEIDDTLINPTNISVIICTYKREKNIYRNIKIIEDAFLLNEISDLYEKLNVVISDNSQTLNINNFNSANIHVYKNKNLGGSGGFTRGLIETLKLKEQIPITHVLLMDDDVVIQPESIYRTYKLFSLIKESYKDSYIGGAMLRMDRPWIQAEAGATWNKGHLISNKAGLNLMDCEACLYNEIEEKSDFNAWWYCAMPINVVRDDNLPLPIFIRGDDVEYGLRNMKNLILMNGICVWHEPFENKYNSIMYYYIFRNRLIDNAIHNLSYTKKQFFADFREQFFRELFILRYKNVRLLLDGIYDFLKGIDWLLEQDGESLNKQVIDKGYKMVDINELSIPFSYPNYEAILKFTETKKEQVKRIMCLNGLFRKPYKTIVATVQETHVAWFYRVDKALNYDYTSKKGFETYFDRTEIIALLREYIKLKKIFNKKYNYICDEYRKRSTELTNMDFWIKYLSI